MSGTATIESKVKRASNATILDKAISYISPAAAVSRIKNRMLFAAFSDSAYEGASRLKRALRTWFPALGSANTDLNTATRQSLIARSRDAYRNQPLAKAIIMRSSDSAIGDGLILQARVDWKTLGITEEEAAAFEDLIESEFSAYANSAECDAERTLNFYQQQYLAFASALSSGDCFALTPYIRRPGNIYEMKVQMIEADRVCNEGNAGNTAQLFDGVEYDTYGAPVQYHICRAHPGDIVVNSEKNFTWDQVPAFGANTGRRRVIHVYWKERPGQSRGIPILTPILEPLKQLSRYTESELMATVISSFFTVFIKSDAPDMGLGETDPLNTNSGNSDGSTNENPDRPSMELGSGKVVELFPGEDISTANPGRPNTAFDGFVMAVLKQIGAGVGIPIEEILLCYTGSYSAARAAMLQAWKMYKTRRKWFATQFCQVIYENWFDEAVARGRIVAPGYGDPRKRIAYTGADWRGPARGAIDETDEITAAQKRVDMGVSSISIEAAELKGVDSRDIHRQRVREHTDRVRDGLEAPVLNAAAREVITPAPTAPSKTQQERQREKLQDKEGAIK